MEIISNTFVSGNTILSYALGSPNVKVAVFTFPETIGTDFFKR